MRIAHRRHWPDELSETTLGDRISKVLSATGPPPADGRSNVTDASSPADMRLTPPTPTSTSTPTSTTPALSAEELAARVDRFYARYSDDLKQIREILSLRLRQLARAYTLQNALPPEAIEVSARVKSAVSFKRKLADKNWPQFYYPTEVVGDLIGARVVCWFPEDCYGFIDLMRTSSHLQVHDALSDYTTNPKQSGYRSIHLDCNVSYDSALREEGKIAIVQDDMTCELQVRTKLQDAWADVTHEFHYKARLAGVEDDTLEGFMADISARLALEDKALARLRRAYQQIADEKTSLGVREGFRKNDLS